MKKLLAVLLLLGMLLSLCACGAEQTAEKAETSTAAADDAELAAETEEDAEEDGPRVLRVGTMETSGGFCPWGDDQTYTGNYLVYERLVQRQPDGSIEPFCCTDYEWVDDTHMVVHMKEGIYFNTGKMMTGEDVLYAFKQSASGVMSTSYGSLDLENSTVSDDGMTVTFAFTEPYRMFESFMDVPQICDSTEAQKLASDEPGWWSSSLGSGPYEVVENVSGAYCSFRLRDDYWDDTYEAQWDEIIINYYTEPTAMFIAFENEELDVICSVSAQDAARLVNGETALGDKAQYGFVSENSVYCLNFSPYCTELQDIKVREAIAHALDTDGLGQVAFGVLYSVADSQIASGVPYYQSAGVYEYDLEYAKQCMAESAYPDGFTLDVVAQGTSEQTAIWEVIQGCLEPLGIKVNFQTYDLGTCLGLWMEEEGNDMKLMTVFGGNSAREPGMCLDQTKSSTPFPAVRIDDEEYQEKLHAATYGGTDEDTGELFAWLQQYLYDEFQAIPMVENLVCYAYNSDTIDHCEFYSGATPSFLWCFAK